MQKHFFSKLQQSIMGGAIIIGSASIISRILGLLRDRLFATHFGGQSAILDSYFTAFKIPDFIFNLLVLGVLSASFVPVFIEVQQKEGKAKAMEVANTIFNILFLSLALVAVVCFVFAPQLVAILSYGDTSEQRTIIVHFTRWMLLSLVFFGMSTVLAGLLVAHKKFLSYSLAPIVYNLGIIFGLLVLVPWLGVMQGLPLGVVIGAAAHVVVQLPAVMRSGFRYRPRLRFHLPAVRRILSLMPPRALALGLTQLNSMIIFAIASTLGTGSRTWWQYADNLQHFPINIFGVSLALAAFPVFSEAFAENNFARFKTVFSENFRRILFFIIPISIATLLLRAQVVRVIYGAGKFSWTDTIITSQVLGMFALSMFAQALIPLLARAFFAKQDTKTPVVISILGTLLNITLALLLVRSMGIIGLALAFSAASIVEMVAMFITLRLRHGDLDDDRIISSTWKIIISSLGMGIVIQGLKYAVAPVVDTHTFIGIFLQTVAALIGGGVAYIIIATQFHFAEARAIADRALSFWRFIKNLLQA